MNQPLINAIDSYYKLKQKYEKQFEDYKKKLRKNESLTRLEKKTLFNQFQPKCVNCKKVGGTVFSKNDRVLKATCGSTEPCKLNIELNQGKYASIIDLDESYSKNVDTIKTKIIMTKLDFLFGYIIDETVAFDNFDKLRKNLKQYMEAQLLVQKSYNTVTINPEKQSAIRDAEGKFYEEIMDLKSLYKLYIENPRDGYITDMVDKYIKVIKPLANKIMEMKYVVNVIEVDDTQDKQDNTMYLVQKEYTLTELEQEVYGILKSGIVRNVL
jgi:hypothetical protein